MAADTSCFATCDAHWACCGTHYGIFASIQNKLMLLSSFSLFGWVSGRGQGEPRTVQQCALQALGVQAGGPLPSNPGAPSCITVSSDRPSVGLLRLHTQLEAKCQCLSPHPCANSSMFYRVVCIALGLSVPHAAASVCMNRWLESAVCWWPLCG